jgi:hypothetical protein
VSWCAVGTAVLTGISALLLGGQRGGPWAVWLAVILVVLLALRSRTLPNAAPVVVCWAGVVAGVAGLLWGLPAWWRLAGLVGVAVVAALAVSIRLPEHVVIRLRGWADLLDKVAMAASVPVLIGMFGLYGRLLGAFS